MKKIYPLIAATKDEHEGFRRWVVTLLIASLASGAPLAAVDYDGDGIEDDPYTVDSDGDYYSDGMENDEGTDPYDSGDYPSGFSPDLDDGTYYQDDPSTMDSDGDGYSDDDETSQGTDPYNSEEYPGSDPMGMDSDGDGYYDDDESSQGTDPYDPLDYPGSLDTTTMDSDGDGYTDDDESSQGTDPYDPSDYPGSSDPAGMDSDGDGYTDDDESSQGTDPNDPSDYPGSSDPAGMDSDGDGYTDDDESSQGTDPNDPSDYPGSSDPTTMDSDGDGLSDDEESSIGTNPNLSDSDGDGLSDYTEHNGYTIDYVYFDAASQTNLPDTYGPLTTDPNNPDSDGDLLEDGWEVANSVDPTDPANGLADGDGDGLSNGEEVALHLTDGNKVDTDEDGEWDGVEVSQGTDPLDQLSRTSLDSDGDVMSDDWENLHALGPADPTDASVDSDGDTLTNFQEYLFGSDPQLAHSDSDGYDDGLEWMVGTDPLDPSDATLDSDGDGAPDLWEALYGFDYGFYDFHDTDDSDGDGLSNSEEYANGYNPTLPDTDGDGISDYDDFWGTGPQDSDGDGLLDDDEINTHGTDPNDVDSDGDELTDYAEIHGIEVIITSGGNSSIVTYTTNPLSDDSDGDGLNDKFEIENFFNPNDLADGSGDDDADGLTTAAEVNLHGTDWTDYDTDGDREKDGYEITQGTDPLDALSRSEADSDGDLMSDAWETSQGLNPADAADANTDLDGDGLTNLEDFQLWAFANNPDSDGDGYQDGFEVDNGKDPADPADATDDSDGDGMPDLWELTYLLDPNVDDADGHVEGDGLSNLEEFLAGTDPNDEDSDDDGRNDGDEVNVAVPAEGQSMADAQAAERYTDPTDSDTDNDGFPDGYETVEGLDPLSSSDGFSDYDGDSIASGDEFEIYQTDWRRKDTDGDGEWDNEEIVAETDPSDILSRSSVDSDGDHMSDVWEAAHGLDASADDGSADEDNDGLENYREYVWRTDPHNPDHDNDGYQDGFERDHGFDPSDGSDGTFDGDGDEMPDLWEITHQLDHNNPVDAGNDEEPDLLSNLSEFQLGTDPRDSDSDSDWLADGEEHNGSGTLTNPYDDAQIAWTYLLDPADSDFDNDGEPDGYEIAFGSDPTDPASRVNSSPDTTVTTHSDGSVTTTISHGGDATTAVTAASNGDVTTVDNHGDGTSNTHIDHGNGETTDIVDNGDGSSTSVTDHGDGTSTTTAVYVGGTTTTTTTDNGDGTSTSVAVDSGGVTTTTTYNADGTSTSVAVDSAGVTTTTVRHADGTRTVTIEQTDGSSNTVTEVYDGDLDRMDDAWETANGLNPADGRDASRDFDYDRSSNLDEFTAGTAPNTDWTFMEIPGLAGGTGGIESLNDLGEFVRLNGLLLERWEGAEWVVRGGFGTGLQADHLMQNNFGLVAVWKGPNPPDNGGSEARIRDIANSTNYTIAPAGASFVEVLRVTDSGFVYGDYKNAAGDLCIFRHREGVTELFGNPAGGDLSFRAGNRRGEFLASFGNETDVQLYAGGQWYPALANENTMAVTDSGELIDAASSALSSFRWMSNAGGDLLRGLHPDLDFYNFAEGAGFTAPGFTESLIEDQNPDNGGSSRPVVPLSMSELGDVVGKVAYLNPGDAVTIQLGNPNDPNSYFPMEVGTDRGFLWRPGDFHLGPGLDSIPDSYDSILYKVNSAGRIATAYWQVHHATGTGDDIEDGYRAVHGVLIPLNDVDQDGLPDSWEKANFGNLAANDGTELSHDTDSLSVYQEYVFNTNPNLADSDEDGVDDDDEISAGMDPLVDDAAEDIDGDNLSWTQEFFYNTSPYDSDTNNNGIDDGTDVADGNDPADADEDGLADVWEVTHFGSIAVQDATGDPDGDELTNLDEQLHGTDPNDFDSDGDGESDATEISGGTDPLDKDDTNAVDTDSDRMPDEWEDYHGLDKNDPADASADHDYDRLTNLQEFLQDTDPTVERVFVPLASGTRTIFDVNDSGAAVGGTENDAFASGLYFWDRSGGYTVVLNDNFQTDKDSIHINNSGLIATTVSNLSAPPNPEMRVFQGGLQGVEQVAAVPLQGAKIAGVTDSGFVYGEFQDENGADKAFRWRKGIFEDLGNPWAGSFVVSVNANERGDLIVNLLKTTSDWFNTNRSYLWKNNRWTTLSGDALAINAKGQIALRRTTTDEVDGESTTSLYLRQADGTTGLLASLNGEQDSTVAPTDEQGSTAALTSAARLLMGGKVVDPDRTVYDLGAIDPSFVDQQEGSEIFFAGRSINRYGEVAGYLSDIDWLTAWASEGDPESTWRSSFNEPATKGIVWFNGAALVDGGPGFQSKFHEITDSGIVSTSLWKLMEEYSDTDGDGEDDFLNEYWSQSHGLLVPANDPDGDGMPDDWFDHHGLAGLADDADADGLSNREEYIYFTDPRNGDTDGDDMEDGWEVTYGLSPVNAGDGGSDSDEDGLTDLEEYNAGTNPHSQDTDGDGESDHEEVSNGTNPLAPDSFTLDDDGDLLPDAWEIYYFNDIISYDADDDADDDSLPNYWELTYRLNPSHPADAGIDSDLDGLINGVEYTLATDPRNKDSDNDGLEDGEEVSLYATIPTERDTDRDGLSDGEEVSLYTTIPTEWDTDRDKLSDGYEVANNLNPLVSDSDGDGFTDYWESKVQFWGRRNQFVTRDANDLVSAWGDSNGGLIEFAQSEDLRRPAQSVAGNIRIGGDTFLEGSSGLNNIVSHIVAVVTVHNVAGFEEDHKELLRLGDVHVSVVASQISVAMGDFDIRYNYVAEGETLLLEIRADRSTNTLRLRINDYPELNLDGFFYYTQGTDSLLLGGVSNSASVDWRELIILSESLDEVAATDVITRLLTDHSLAFPLDPPPPPQNTDSDLDGMPDWWETRYSLDNSVDDSTGDPDGDLGNNLLEYQSRTDPRVFDDSDEDEMSDFWELDNDLIVGIDDSALDPDGDHVSNLLEYQNGTDPQRNNDFDRDGMPDEWEALYVGLDPTVDDAGGDLDNDLLTNLEEFLRGSNPTVVDDSDQDGLPDGWEIVHGFDPDQSGDEILDIDRDLLTNLDEYNNNTNPRLIDSDGDAYPDWIEVGKGSNPTLASDQPTADLVVGSVGSGTYSSITAALQAVTTDGQIVQLSPGSYRESIDLDTLIHSVLIVGAGHLDSLVEGAAASATIQAGAGSSPQFISGITITHADMDSGRGIELGAGAQLSANNVVLTGNRRTSDSGSAAKINGAILRLENSMVVANSGDSTVDIADGIFETVHSTIANNIAANGGAAIELSHSAFRMENSILWNPDADEIAILDPNPMSSASTIEIRGAVTSGLDIYDSAGAEVEGVVDFDPWLTAHGYLTDQSAAIDTANSISVPGDIHLESRGGGATTDHGADRFIDTDGDGLPDWFEDRNGLDSSNPNDALSLAPSGDSYLSAYMLGRDPNATVVGPTTDNDRDGLLNSEESTLATDPNFPDHPLVDLEVTSPPS